MNCEHNNVTMCKRLVHLATLYEPAEYATWAVCDECGEETDTFADVSDCVEADPPMRGMPHEFFD